jgi:CRP-like cAMP-binding protein
MEMSALRRIRLFDKLGNEALAALSQIAKPVKVARGHTIIREGETNSSLYLLDQGSLHVRLESEGQKVFVGRLEEGSALGEISLFDPGPATATVAAATDVLLYELRHADFTRFIDEQPTLACAVVLAIVKDLAQRFRQTDQRLQAANLMSGGLRP